MPEELETAIVGDIFTLRTGKRVHFRERTELGESQAKITFFGNVTLERDVEFRILSGGICLIGRDSTLGESFRIRGRDIVLERSFWSGRYCTIGGGSCYEPPSRLRFGYFGHMGDSSYVNTARPVTIGQEVGLGISTRLYTHGAYLEHTAGFPAEFGPITLGNNVWIPQATVMPNVHIGDNVVVAAGSVVNKDLPAGCLAGGVPSKVIREGLYPNYVETRSTISQVIEEFRSANRSGKLIPVKLTGTDTPIVKVEDAEFNIKRKTITGKVTPRTEVFRDHLRRYGIRFPYETTLDGNYQKWTENL